MQVIKHLWTIRSHLLRCLSISLYITLFSVYLLSSIEPPAYLQYLEYVTLMCMRGGNNFSCCWYLFLKNCLNYVCLISFTNVCFVCASGGWFLSTKLLTQGFQNADSAHFLCRFVWITEHHLEGYSPSDSLAAWFWTKIPLWTLAGCYHMETQHLILLWYPQRVPKQSSLQPSKALPNLHFSWYRFKVGFVCLDEVSRTTCRKGKSLIFAIVFFPFALSPALMSLSLQRRQRKRSHQGCR